MSIVTGLPVLDDGGKTKIIYGLEGDNAVYSKDDMTAFNGKRHAVIPGKGAWSNTVTCNIFEVLKACGLPVAFKERLDEQTFRSPRVTMLPYEIVIRRHARGSVCKAYPDLVAGHRFDKLPVQFFLKTSERQIGGVSVPDDDPLIVRILMSGVCVIPAGVPYTGTGSFVLATALGAQLGHPHPFTAMQRIGTQVFLVLESLWAEQGLILQDLKIECALDEKGRLVIADVVDPDSWRLQDKEGKSHDKDPFRLAETLEEAIAAIQAIYPDLAARSERFTSPTAIARAADYMRSNMRRMYRLPDEIETATDVT